MKSRSRPERERERERILNLDKELAIGEVFDLSAKTNNDDFTKSFIEKHKGNIPVYGASKDRNYVSYGYVKDNLPSIEYFENCLTWNRDGSIGKVFFRKGRFCLSKNVFPLIVRNDYKILLDEIFLKYTLEKELAKYNFDFTNKASKGRIKDIKIKIPLNSQGNFDLAKQQEVAKKYQQIEEIKEKIKIDLEKIENTKIKIDLE